MDLYGSVLCPSLSFPLTVLAALLLVCQSMVEFVTMLSFGGTYYNFPCFRFPFLNSGVFALTAMPTKLIFMSTCFLSISSFSSVSVHWSYYFPFFVSIFCTPIIFPWIPHLHHSLIRTRRCVDIPLNIGHFYWQSLGSLHSYLMNWLSPMHLPRCAIARKKKQCIFWSFWVSFGSEGYMYNAFTCTVYKSIDSCDTLSPFHASVPSHISTK